MVIQSHTEMLRSMELEAGMMTLLTFRPKGVRSSSVLQGSLGYLIWNISSLSAWGLRAISARQDAGLK